MVHDITEQKKGENELKASKEKLSLALAVGNICDWEWDLQKDEITYGEQMEIMLGFIPCGSRGISYADFEKVVHEEDISHFRNTFYQAVRDDTPIETIFRTKPKSGKSKYLNAKAVVDRNEENNPVRITGVFFDITELKEGTDHILLKLHEELLRSNKELENFAYVASHDLQEPLRMVSSFTQLLSNNYKNKILDETAQEYIRFAVDGSRRMYDLINGLLAYSKVQTKGKAFTPVDLNHVIESVKKNLVLTLKERNVVLNVTNLPVILADASQMIQLFQNLISNSIKFNSGLPKIYISSKEQKSDFVFSVRDNGLGIESQYFEKIFMIFQRLLPKDQFEGTGIGLSICKRIVERHGGKIWVESVPEEGSTFYFTLPKKSFNA
jgi:signal transduction histidine kinase